MTMRKEVWTVSQINSHIKNLLQGDSFLCALFVKGEISNFTRHSSGHLYFSLKDQGGSIKCVMFRGNAQRLQFRPEHGMEVLIAGYVSVYERDGAYQLYVEEMMAAGAGALHAAYEKRRQALLQEGLFDDKRKRPLPVLPKTVGIVTSPTGAAIRDILSILKRRNPKLEILVIPAVVQGADGEASLCAGLDYMYQLPVDVIIVGRGGGSLEELWCFNEEAVVRKIAESPVPIISAVGHETDFTLSDFAADVRAATPSMAAELATPVFVQVMQELILKKDTLLHKYQRLLEQKRLLLETYRQHPLLARPERYLQENQQALDEKVERLRTCMEKIYEENNTQLQIAAQRLDALSPLKVFHRGYAICQKENGQLIRNVQEVNPDDRFVVLLQNGKIIGTVIGREETNGEE